MEDPMPERKRSSLRQNFNAVLLVKRFFRVARAFFAGDAKWQAWTLLTLLVVLACGGTGMHVVISYTRKDFANALTDKKADDFYRVVLRFAGIIAFAAPFLAIADYVQGKMVLEWRLWLTNLLLSKYFANRAFFNLKLEGVLDNPDQRICEDVGNFVSSSVAVIKMTVEKVLSIFAFSAVLWSISPSVVAFLLTYALLGTYITLHVFGKKMMQLKFEGLQREADLRYSLVRVRDNVESIAFYRGEQSEAASIRFFLSRLAANIQDRLSWDFVLNVFTNGYRFATFLIPGLVLAPRLFRGEIRYGDVVQTAMAFHEIFRAVTVLVLRFDLLSSLAAETERLESLLTSLGLTGDDTSTGLKGQQGQQGQQGQHGQQQAGVGQPWAQKPKESMLVGILRALQSLWPWASSRSTLLPSAAHLRRRMSLGKKTDDPDPPHNHQDMPDNKAARGGRTQNGALHDSSEMVPLLPLGVSGGGSGDPAHQSLMTPRDPHSGHQSTEALSHPDSIPNGHSGTVSRFTSEGLSVQGLRIMLPGSGQVLYPSGLSFELGAGQSLLVMGPSGCGKSSLLRVISGLWSRGEGRVGRPGDEDVFFLPQKPYMPLGSLREQVLFPHSRATGASDSDERLAQLLQTVCLPDIVERFPSGLDEDCDWSATLSVGEQQRVAFARLVHHRPSIAFLDEATSALDTANERTLYELMSKEVPCFVSVGHRLSLLPYHTHVLWYDGDRCQWNVSKSDEFARLHALTLQVD